MCIHSAAEGLSIAGTLFSKLVQLFYLWLVSLYGNSGIGMMVVIALLVHKAPEAIGYGLFLEHNSCTKP